MKGRAFIIAFALAALIVGCSKSSPDASVTTGTPDDGHGHGTTGSSDPKPAVSTLKELKTETTTQGKGEGAKDGDTLTMLYRGTLANNTVFDGNMDEKGVASPEKPPFGLLLGGGGVIKGWDQGLVGIKVGETRKLSIPASLGYGEQSMGSIPPNSDLFFTVKCLDIVRKGEEMVIDIKDVKQGSGPAVKNGDKVTIQYVGTLLTGKQFDSTRDKGKSPFTFTVGNGEVVPGFDKGLLGMKKGGLRKLKIPPQAAYGANPQNGMPGNAVLLFEIELVKIG